MGGPPTWSASCGRRWAYCGCHITSRRISWSHPRSDYACVTQHTDTTSSPHPRIPAFFLPAGHGRRPVRGVHEGAAHHGGQPGAPNHPGAQGQSGAGEQVGGGGGSVGGFLAGFWISGLQSRASLPPLWLTWQAPSCRRRPTRPFAPWSNADVGAAVAANICFAWCLPAGRPRTRCSCCTRLRCWQVGGCSQKWQRQQCRQQRLRCVALPWLVWRCTCSLRPSATVSPIRTILK